MMPIVVGEFEPTKLPKKLLGALFLASQATQVQGNYESTAVAQYEEVILHYRLLVLVVLVYLFGFVSGGLGSLRGELHVAGALRGAAGDLRRCRPTTRRWSRSWSMT